MIKYSRIVALLLLDTLLINLSYIIAFLLRFEFDVEAPVFVAHFAVFVRYIPLITIITLAVYWMVGLYNSLWKYAGIEEIVKVALATLISAISIVTALFMTGSGLPRSIYIISAILNFICAGGLRLSYRFFRDMRTSGNVHNFFLQWRNGDSFVKAEPTKVMVVGAGDAGATIIREIKMHPEFGKKVVIVVDDDPAKLRKHISGVKIAGNHKSIKTLARKNAIDEIIIAIPSASKKVIQEIANECNKTRCKLKILPGLIDLINEKVSISKLRDVDIEDLLGRDPVQVNLREISSYIEGRIVLITGGGGSIGSELCRQIARFKPRKLIALDIYENSVFELANELKTTFPTLSFEIVIGSVRSKTRMREVFVKYKPHVVFHAAAHKHVPLMETNPKEAVVNNILGTKNLLDLSDEYSIEKFVMISTDKAVNPANVMGATKRVAEMILQTMSETGTSKTSYAAVRFGNVLGSNGSVIPIFRKQIEKGGPVTVTHEDINRYFMTIPEAVQLVIQTGAMAEGGEIFILDMGDPVRIMDLAENVIRLSGYVPYVDIDIQVTGLRPGEKLYEELLLDEEGIEKTSHHKIYVGHPIPASPEVAKFFNGESSQSLEEKIEEVVCLEDQDVKEWLRQLVPNYQLENNKRGE